MVLPDANSYVDPPDYIVSLLDKQVYDTSNAIGTKEVNVHMPVDAPLRMHGIFLKRTLDPLTSDLLRS